MTRPDTVRLHEIIDRAIVPWDPLHEEAMNILDAVDDALDAAEQAELPASEATA